MIIKRQKEFTSRATKMLRLSVVPEVLSKRGHDVSRKYVSKNARTVLESQEEQVARLMKEHLGRGTTPRRLKGRDFETDHFNLLNPMIDYPDAFKHKLKERHMKFQSMEKPNLPDVFKNGRRA